MDWTRSNLRAKLQSHLVAVVQMKVKIGVPIPIPNHAPRQSLSDYGQAEPGTARGHQELTNNNTDRPRRCYSTLANFVSAYSGS